MRQLHLLLLTVILGGLLTAGWAAPAPKASTNQTSPASPAATALSEKAAADKAFAEKKLADKAFATAKQLYEMRLDEQAVIELQKFLLSYPADPRLHEAAFLLGRTFQRQGQYGKAVEQFNKVITKALAKEQTHLRAEAHFQTAECYLAQKEFDKAIKAYGNCLALQIPDSDLNARAQYWLAESYYQLNQYENALGNYRKVAEVAPRHALASWAVYSMGMIELRLERFGNAIGSLERVTTTYKDAEVAGEATLALGFAYAGRGRTASDTLVREKDYRKAAEIFTAALGDPKVTAPARQQALLSLAQVQFDLKTYDAAAATYAKALAGVEATSDQAQEIRLQRGHALYNAAQYPEAAADYGTVAAVKAGELASQAVYWLGNSWYMQAERTREKKAYTEAIAAFKRFLAAPGERQKPQVPRAALLIAFCYEDLATDGEAALRTEAIAAFKQVLDKWANSREASQAQAGLTRLTANMTSTELGAVVTTLPTGPASQNAALRLAREAFLAGKYEEAQTAAKKVLAENPTADVAAQASYLIGACAQKLGQSAIAIPAYKTVLEKTTNPELVRYAQRGLTQAYLDTQRYPLAREAALALLKLPPQGKTPEETMHEQAEALMYLAGAALGTQQPAEALATYEKVLAECPTSPLLPQAFMDKAWVQESRKDRTAAIGTYRDFLAKFPTHDLAPDAAFRLGVNLAEKKEFAPAIDAFGRVPEKHKLADQAAYAIAWAFRDQGQHDLANARFMQVADRFAKSPLAVDSLYRIGEYWLEQKKYADALKAFTRAHQTSGDLVGQESLAALIAYKLGVCAFNEGQFALATDAFGKVAQSYPTSEYAAESLFWRGQAQEKLAQAPAARDTYTRYVAKYPAGEKLLDAALGSGRAALTAKQYAIARDDLQKALQACSQHERGANATLIERAQNVAPEAQFYLGMTYYEEKAYTDAIKEFAVVKALYNMEPWFSKAMLQMARASLAFGNRTAAKSTLEQLIRAFRDHPQFESIKGQALTIAKEATLDLKVD
jgi:TolA-binding protein